MRNMLWIGAALLAAACGDSPVAPSSPPAPAPPAAPPEVKIVAVGSLTAVQTYRCSPPDSVCPGTTAVYTIDGVGQNVGAGCVSEISGVTTVDGVSMPWTVSNSVTPGSQFWYTVRLETRNEKLAGRVENYTTTFKAKSGC